MVFLWLQMPLDEVLSTESNEKLTSRARNWVVSFYPIAISEPTLDSNDRADDQEEREMKRPMKNFEHTDKGLAKNLV